MKLIDLTQSLSAETLPYPGDKPVEIETLSEGGYNISNISACLHTGTHCDFPVHAGLEGGAELFTVDRMFLPCALIDCGGKTVDGGLFDDVYVRTEALMIRTGHCEKAGKPEYFTDFPSFTEQAVKRIINRRIKILALDTPSLSTSPEDDFRFHRGLLSAGIIIVEGLVNTYRLPKNFMLMTFPLKITGSDGAPARVAAWV